MINLQAVATATGKYVHVRFNIADSQVSDTERKGAAGSMILTPPEWVAIRDRLNGLGQGPAAMGVEVIERVHARSEALE